MRIRNDLSSAPYNSFGIDVPLGCLIEIENSEDLPFLSPLKQFRVLGGGSNVLIADDLTVPVVLVNNRGIERVVEKEDYCLVEFAAGETWHDAVLWALDNKLGGMENLSLIPGKCGAAPMQNIGAYGVEIKDILHSVKAFDLSNGLDMSFYNTECGFAYRTSHFKTKWKDRFIISSIVLKLSKEGYHRTHTEYGAIREQLASKGVIHPGIRDISEAVIAIRSSKLPDPKLLGNAGSFFKNPVVPRDKYQELIKEFPELVAYPAGEEMKLAAGWLIDACGLKGMQTESGAAVHDKQALVLVRRGKATGNDILRLAGQIKEKVWDTFGVTLEEEVNIWS